MTDLIARLRELSLAAAEGRHGEFYMSIPARPDRDADLVLQTAANEIERLRAENDTFRTRYVTRTAYDAVKQIVEDDTALLRQICKDLTLISDGSVDPWATHFADRTLAALRERLGKETT